MFLFTTQIAASHLHSLFSPVPWSWSHKGPCRNKAQCLDQAARPRGWEVPLVIWAGIPREITASKSDRNNQVMIRKEKKTQTSQRHDPIIMCGHTGRTNRPDRRKVSGTDRTGPFCRPQGLVHLAMLGPVLREAFLANEEWTPLHWLGWRRWGMKM